MQTVAGQFLGRDIGAQLACFCTLLEQVGDDTAKVLVGSHHVFATMQERSELRAVVLTLHQRERLEDSPAFLTGLVQSLGTSWGLFRHYWVLAKLLLTVW